MNLGDRYLQYRGWVAANPKAARALQIGLIAFGLWLVGYIMGRMA